MLDAKPCSSPSTHKQQFQTTASTLLADPTFYRSITRAPQHLTLTKPDLAFVAKLTMPTYVTAYYN